MKVAISIPALNEEKDLGNVLEEINSVMKDTKYDYKVYVLDDGSTDRTVEIAKKAGAIVNSNGRNLGLAETFKHELRVCLKDGADVIVHTDADGQYKASDIVRLLKKLEEGYDLVIGSRFSHKIEHMPFMKRLGNKAFAVVFSKLLKVKLTDTTTGFRAFTKEVAEGVKFINTFTYTQEQLIKASKLKFRIAEIPIKTRSTRESRLFKSAFGYAIRAWINILRIYRDFAPLRFFGSIGAFFLLIGVAIGIWLVTVFIRTGDVTHIPSAILAMLLITTGIQVILFGFFADKS
jgi:glycosyltransferase involved in cell wall biosynthesis